MEVFTRGLLQGSHNVLENLIELSKIDLLEVKENGTENTEPDGHDAGSGHY